MKRTLSRDRQARLFQQWHGHLKAHLEETCKGNPPPPGWPGGPIEWKLHVEVRYLLTELAQALGALEANGLIRLP